MTAVLEILVATVYSEFVWDAPNLVHEVNALQGGRSRVRFLTKSLGLFSDLMLRPHYVPGVDRTSDRNK